MKIGLPKEIKIAEKRVALTPANVAKLTRAGHQVFIEEKAGKLSGLFDKDYLKAGAKICQKAQEVWNSDLVVKVKEPQETEFKFFRPGLILFTYLHLAAFPELLEKLMQKEVVAIDYATVELDDGSLPLLKPMSEVAGRLASQIGQRLVRKHKKIEIPKIVILGGGTAGKSAAEIALTSNSQVTILEKNPKRIEVLKEEFKKFPNQPEFFLSENQIIEKLIPQTDLLIGTVLISGARAPKLVSEEMVKKMKKGSVIVDVSIDQGGCCETSRPTTHEKPTFIKHGVIHYCVANMPGIVPEISTFALTDSTFPYIFELANKGLEKALRENPALAKGVNVYKGKITNQKLAESFGKEYTPLEKLL